MKLHIGFGSRDEECTCLMDHVESSKIDIATIHDVDRSGFQGDQVQRWCIAHLTTGNMDKTRYRPSQIEQRVHFDGCFRHETPPTETLKGTNRLWYCRGRRRC